MDDPIYRRSVELLEADINDELVALEPSQGSCFGFNAVAKDVWRKLDEPRSFAALRDYLLGEYEVAADQCSSELRGLLDEMEQAKLIERVAQ